MAWWNRSVTASAERSGSFGDPTRSGKVEYKKSLTAAAERYTGGPDQARAANVVRQGINNDIWNYYDTIGELHHAGRFVANSMSKVRLRVGYMSEDEERPILIGPDTDMPAPVKAILPTASLLVRSLKSRIGGQRRLMYRLGLNLSMPGDCWLLATDTVGPRNAVVDRNWEVLSCDELRASADGRSFVRYRGMGYPSEPLPANTFPFRIWLDHPRFTYQADSSVRPLLEILEELMLLTREVRGGTLSRLTGPGLLLYPNEISWPDAEGEEGTDSDDPVGAMLTKVMMTAISDKGSAAGQVPIAMGVPMDTVEKFKFISFHQRNDALSVEKRTEAIQRFGQGIDLPVELVTGHKDTTFANADKIDENLYKAYVGPFVDCAVDSLTVVYFQDGLKRHLGIPSDQPLPEDMQRLVIYGDYSDAVIPPDKSKQATDGVEIFAVSLDSWRTANGFTDADKPDDAEVEERILRQQRLNSREDLRVTETAEGNDIVGKGSKPVAPPAGTAPAPAKTPAKPKVPSQIPKPPEKGAKPGPKPGATVEADLQLLAERALQTKIMVASEHAIEKAMDYAGAKIRPKFTGMTAISDDLLCARVGQKAIVDKNVDPETLIRGQFKALGRLSQRWACDAGCAVPGAVASQVMAVVESAARQRLFDPSYRLPQRAIADAIKPPKGTTP